MGAALGIDQLCVDVNLVASPSHAPLQDIANAELAADLPHIDRFTPVGNGCGVGDHKAARNPRKIGRQIIGYTVREIFLIRVVRQVREWQHDD
jgi:hypothetical protein